MFKRLLNRIRFLFGLSAKEGQTMENVTSIKGDNPMSEQNQIEQGRKLLQDAKTKTREARKNGEDLLGFEQVALAAGLPASDVAAAVANVKAANQATKLANRLYRDAHNCIINGHTSAAPDSIIARIPITRDPD